jgi:hypothetical protein
MAKLSAKINALGTKVQTKDKAGNPVETDGKGTLSVYGLSRFPVSLYANQWQELASAMPAIVKIVEQAVKEGKMSKERAAGGVSATGRISLG